MKASGLPHVMIANLAQQAVAFFGVLVVAKLLPPDQFAMVRIAMAYVAVVAVIGAGGLTAPILRYCADPGFSVDQRRILLGISLKRIFLVSLATTLLALLLIAISGRGKQESMVLVAYALQIPTLAGASLLMVYLQAMQQFRLLAYSQVGIRLLSFFLTALAAWFFGLKGLLFAAWMASILGFLPLLRAALPKYGTSNIKLPLDFFGLARFSLLGMLISTAGQYVDLMMLDWVGANRRLVAVYSLATIFFFALSGLAGAVQSIATPAFTGLMGNPVAFRSCLRRWTLQLVGAGILSSIGVICFAWGLQHWFLGNAYQDLWLLVAVLMVRFCIWCTYAVGGAAFVGIGVVKPGIWISCVTTALAFLIGYPLCSIWGVWGAAWTQVAVALVSSLLIGRLISIELTKKFGPVSASTTFDNGPT